MRKEGGALALRVALAMSLLGCVPAQAATPISHCPYSITAPGVYAVTQDLTCAGPAIKITASNVDLDLGGHALSGSGQGDGIIVQGGANVNIHHGTVQGFGGGILLNGALNCKVSSVTASRNTSGGIQLFNATGNTVTGNTTSQVGNGAGIYLNQSSGNTATRNTADQNYTGISVAGDSSYGNTVSLNTASGNRGPGIQLLSGPTQNTVQGNMCSGNLIGIALGTFGYGGASRNTIQSNTVNLNSFGILVERDSPANIGNTFQGNTALANGNIDVEDDNPGCGSNTWLNNRFVTYLAGEGSNAACLLGQPTLEAETATGTWTVLSLEQNPGDVANPSALAVDGTGNLYVVDGQSSPRIERRDAQGNWSVLAVSGDAPGQLRDSVALAADAAGNLYVADNAQGGRIQERDAQGKWTTMSTNGSALGQVGYPSALAVDSAGNLYVADEPGGDYHHWRIQERDARGKWSLVATYGDAPGAVDGPTALAVDPMGNLYVTDTPALDGFGRIQRRDAQGNWSVIAPAGIGPGQVSSPSAVAVDSGGNLYVVDDGGLQRRDTHGNWSALGIEGASSLAVDAADNLYVADRNTGGYLGRIQERDPKGNWSLVASYADSAGHVFGPTAVAVHADGTLYVADSVRLQKRDVQGNWSVTATEGTGLGQISSPTALALDSAGNLYVADGDDGGPGAPRGRIEKRDAQGTWSALATAGAALGQVDEPLGLAIDAAGNLYLSEAAPLRMASSETVQGRVQRRDAQGSWSVVAPSGMGLGQVWFPSALAVDTGSNLYVGQNPPGGAGRIEKRDGQGSWSALVPGDTVPGRVNGPRAVAVDPAGNLYVVDYGSDGGRIQKRDAQGNWFTIATVGAELGQITYPAALAVDGAGHLYVADTNNNRVLKYAPAPGP